MPDYIAQFRQAMSEGNTDFARTIIMSAMQGAKIGVISDEELHDFTEEVKANPPV